MNYSTKLDRTKKLYPKQEHYRYMRACLYGHLDDVIYLLTSPELESNANINFADDIALKCACKGGFQDIINYLILEQNMRISDKTKEWLKGDNDDELKFDSVVKLIEFRDFNLHLKETLEIKDSARKKHKI